MKNYGIKSTFQKYSKITEIDQGRPRGNLRVQYKEDKIYQTNYKINRQIRRVACFTNILYFNQ